MTSLSTLPADMTVSELAELMRYLEPAERDELQKLLDADKAAQHWRPLPGPQTMAYESAADVTGYGGSAGSGKTELAIGLATTRHQRVLIARREKAQTEGIVQRLGELVGSTAGYTSQKSAWNVPLGTRPLIEFAGLDNPGDEARQQGRPRDLLIFDEVTEMREYQVRFIMGWLRSADPTIRARVLMTFNPPTTVEGRWVLKYFGPWLDDKHVNPAQPGELRWFSTIAGVDAELPDARPFVVDEVTSERDYGFDARRVDPERIVRPKSRTFIPGRVTDNPFYMASGYMSQLQALPEPLRSQMLYGDFKAGVQDSPLQVCPTEWVEAAMARWSEPRRLPEMLTLGVDVARGGPDNTVIAARHVGMWFGKPIVYPGKETPNGPLAASLVIAAQRDSATMAVDAIGVGGAVYDFLVQARQQVLGVIVSQTSDARDKSGMMTFANLRTEHWWRMREALDPASNTGIALPPDARLKADLCAPKWSVVGRNIKVQSRDEIVRDIGRSPDWASAYILALLEHPKAKSLPRGLLNTQRREYHPLDYAERP